MTGSFILTLFAIAMELREDGTTLAPMLSVELAVGLPPEHYGTLRDKFANYSSAAPSSSSSMTRLSA